MTECLWAVKAPTGAVLGVATDPRNALRDAVASIPDAVYEALVFEVEVYTKPRYAWDGYTIICYEEVGR